MNFVRFRHLYIVVLLADCLSMVQILIRLIIRNKWFDFYLGLKYV